MWRDKALCLHSSGNWFDILSGGEKRQRDDKKMELATCESCSVMEECKEAGKREHDGIWGGTLPRDRGFRPRSRN